MYATEKDVIKLISEIEADPSINVKVPSKLNNPVDLVEAARRTLSNRNEKTDWSLKNEGILVNTGNLSIRVSPKNVNRALLIFDTLIKVFRARGHKFSGTSVDIGGQVFEISIREKLNRIENDYKKTPTGILCLKAFGGYPLFEVYDSTSVLIEEKIARVVAKLELYVKGLKEIWARNAMQREAEKEEERKSLEQIARKEKELQDFKALLSASHRATEARMVRDYVKGIEDKAKQTGEMSPDLENWISWARNKADWYDPHIEKDDPLLAGIDKATLQVTQIDTPFH